MLQQISLALKEYESQGYPVSHLHISNEYLTHFEEHLKRSKDVDGNKIVSIVLNSRKYAVKAPAGQNFGNVQILTGGAPLNGVFAIGPDGGEYSLLKDENYFRR
jgi:hypothetical protein